MIHLNDWKSKHTSVDFGADILSFIDTGSYKEILLIIHGFGSSSFDYYKLLPKLKNKYRVIAVDLIGFGLSSKPKNYYFSILDHAQLLIQFINSLNITSFSILSHGFGTSILCEILNIITLNSLDIKLNNLFLLNGSLTIESSNNKSSEEIIENTITSKFVKITISYELYKKYFKEALGNKEAISEEEFKILYKLQEINNGLNSIKFIDYSIKERKLYANKWVNILKKIKNNVHIIWGVNDVLSSLLSADKLLKELELTKLYKINNCGHFTMLEKPNELSEIILSLKN